MNQFVNQPAKQQIENMICWSMFKFWALQLNGSFLSCWLKGIQVFSNALAHWQVVDDFNFVWGKNTADVSMYKSGLKFFSLFFNSISRFTAKKLLWITPVSVVMESREFTACNGRYSCKKRETTRLTDSKPARDVWLYDAEINVTHSSRQ